MVLNVQLDHPAEQIVLLDDSRHGLEGAIVIHSTTLGPAAGGCRYWTYGSASELICDASRLAAGMAYKNALAGLPLGGGKAVLRRFDGAIDRDALFRAFGSAVERLRGRYVTAEDVGTTPNDMLTVAARSRYVAGLPVESGRPGGDPSPWTARGVLIAMKAAVEAGLHKPLGDCVVAVQGLGNVGSHLARMLALEGASLIVADVDPLRVAAVVDATSARAVSVDDILSADVDVFAPCALGGVLTHRTVSALRARVVCGGANNQLGEIEDGARLADHGVLYAPDYVVNAGGIINVAAEYLGWSADEARCLVDATGERLEAVLANARRQDCPSNIAADRLAQSIIARASTDLERAA